MPLTYAPDADPTTPGILIDAEAWPTAYGTYIGVPVGPTLASSAVAGSGARIGAAEQDVGPDATRIWFTAVTGGSGRVDRIDWTAGGSPAVTSGVTVTGTEAITMTQFGTVMLAANQTAGIRDLATGSAIGGAAIRPALITTVGLQVMAANYVDVVGATTYEDGWWCSALGDHTVWGPAVASNAANGRLLESPGAITALAPLGGYCVAYKKDAIFLGQFIGPPVIWSWQRIGMRTGCAGFESLVQTPRGHYYVDPGNRDIMHFDGSSARSIGEGVRHQFFATLEASRWITGAYDRVGKRIFWFHVPTVGGTHGYAYVYCLQTGQWSRFTSAELNGGFGRVLGFSGPFPSNVKGLHAAASSGATMKTVAACVTLSATTNAIKGLFEPSTNGTFYGRLRTGRIGSNTGLTLVRRVIPRQVRPISVPASWSLTPYGSMYSGEAETAGSPIAMPSGGFRWDYLASRRWHSFDLVAGTRAAPIADCMEMSGIDYEFGKGIGRESLE